MNIVKKIFGTLELLTGIVFISVLVFSTGDFRDTNGDLPVGTLIFLSVFIFLAILHGLKLLFKYSLFDHILLLLNKLKLEHTFSNKTEKIFAWGCIICGTFPIVLFSILTYILEKKELLPGERAMTGYILLLPVGIFFLTLGGFYLKQYRQVYILAGIILAGPLWVTALVFAIPVMDGLDSFKQVIRLIEIIGIFALPFVAVVAAITTPIGLVLWHRGYRLKKQNQAVAVQQA